MNENQRMGGQRPPLRRQGTPRRGTPQLHDRRRPTSHQRRQGGSRGYQLQSHSINFAGRRGKYNAVDPRAILVLAAGLVAVVLLAFAVVSCVSGSGSATEESRVAQGLPQDLTDALNNTLDRDDQLAAIAKNAGDYPESLVRLAVDHPDAVAFVAGWPDASKEAQPYTDSVEKGTVPELFGWDTRWGYVSYGDGLIAVDGSGPVAAAMARMALLGNADQTPATIAQAAADAGKATGDAGTDASFFTEKAGDLGLTVKELDLSATTSSASGQTDGSGSSDGTASDNGSSSDAADSGDTTSADGTASDNGSSSNQDGGRRAGEALANALSESTYVLVQTTGGALGGSPRWVLVCLGDDGAVTVHDPLSAENSARPWDPATVAADTATALVVSAPAQQQENQS